MSGMGTTTPKKRGQPAKYASTDEKKAANAQRRRTQRKNKAAGAEEVQFQQPHITGPGEAAFFWPPILGRAVGAAQSCHEGSLPNESNNIREFLSPLSPLGSPSLNPLSTEIDDATDYSLANSETPMGTGRSGEAECDDIVTISDGMGAVDEDGDRITDNIVTGQEAEEASKVADRLVDQLIRHQGCCTRCHQQLQQEHTESHSNHVGLQDYLDKIREAVDCPDVLEAKTITTHESSLAGQIDGASRRQLYCGLGKEDVSPAPICLEIDDQATATAEVAFDIDSVLGFPSSLGIAKQGIRWNPTQMAVSDLRSDLHLDSHLAHYVDSHGHAYSVRKPLHQLPHYTFGRLVGFKDVSLYLFFPHLYREEQKMSRLLDNDFRTWMDRILLPVLYQHHGSSLVQHYPSSYDHARCNSTARGVETRSQRTDATPRQQLLFHFLPPDSLHAMWETILQAVERPGLQQFRGVFLFLQGKNLECLTKDST